MFSTDLYALLSETLVGSATVATICIVLWLLRCNEDLRFIEYFRNRINFFFGGHEPGPPHWRRSDGAQAAAAKEPTREKLLYPVVGSVVLGLGLAVQSAVDDLIDHKPIAIQVVAERRLRAKESATAITEKVQVFSSLMTL